MLCLLFIHSHTIYLGDTFVNSIHGYSIKFLTQVFDVVKYIPIISIFNESLNKYSITYSTLISYNIIDCLFWCFTKSVVVDSKIVAIKTKLIRF